MMAGPGPVTITNLAAFAVPNQPALRLGYYVQGSPSSTTQLFSFNQNDSQTMAPTAVGSTSFHPGAPGKFRFFPLKNADGSVGPNAFIFAAEDNNIPFGSIQPYDSNDIVGIIRNVQAAPGAIGAPANGVVNLEGAPISK